MKTLTTRAYVTPDHRVIVQAPPDIPPGDVEVVVVVEETRTRPQTEALTIDDLGWSQEKAREVRTKLATFAEDWDDPRMDVYNSRRMPEEFSSG
jgi:hypothetical protein